MCFYIDPKNKRKKTAKEDIVCYKNFKTNIRKNNIESIYFEYFWEIEKQETTEIGNIVIEHNPIKEEAVIHKGFHSFSSKAFTEAHNKLAGLFYTVTDNTSYVITYECVIPKGSKYYYNSRDEEYVSNCMIIKKKIN